MEGEKQKEDIYYELMPHKKIKAIKTEIDRLKKKAEKESFSSKSFRSSVDNLKQSIDSLMDLFKEATESMKAEEKAEEEVSKKIMPLLARMDDIEEQNRKIAEGIVTVADMVSELKEETKKRPAPMPPPIHMRHIPKPRIVMPPPKPEQPFRMPEERAGVPAPSAAPWERPAPMPPPGPPIPPMPETEFFEPEKKKKKGLLGGLLKK